MRRLTWLAVVPGLLGGCAFLDGTFSNIGAQEFDEPLIDAIPIEGNEVLPIEFAVAIDQSTPTYRIPATIDTSRWGAFLWFDAARAARGDEADLVIELADFVLTGDGDVRFAVAVETRSGSIYGADMLDPVPVAVPSCQFTLSPATATGVDFATRLRQCTLDWVTANGMPDEFDLVVATSGATSSHALAPADATTWSMSGIQGMSTKRPIASGCVERDAIDFEGIEDFVLEDVALAVSGAAGEHGASVLAGVIITNPLGAYITKGEFDQRVEAGTGYFVTAGASVELDINSVPERFRNARYETNTTGITLNPSSPSEFVLKSVYTLVGWDPVTRTTLVPGHGKACWTTTNDDVPNSGYINWSILGVFKPR